MFWFNSLAEEISKQPSIDSVVSLLVLTLMKIYDERRKENYLRRKGAPESRIESSPVFKEINMLKNRIKGVVTSEKNPNPAKFLTCEKELKEKLRAGYDGTYL